MARAFSPSWLFQCLTYGCAIGWYEIGPLALTSNHSPATKKSADATYRRFAFLTRFVLIYRLLFEMGRKVAVKMKDRWRRFGGKKAEAVKVPVKAVTLLGQGNQKKRNIFTINHQHQTIPQSSQGQSSHFFSERPALTGLSRNSRC